ncbi:serine hydrolase [Novosphingobium sp. NPDC080210]|uniref:serine hydrolase n=1 Tax=Novosphingobium sp. NPDC080210 TaxID=3390596 RepID=UPI003D041D87
MKTGFISKLGSLVLASALLAPLGTAQANTTLESEFDRAFVSPSSVKKALPKVSVKPLAKPVAAADSKAKALVQTTKKLDVRPNQPTVRRFVPYGQPRSFASDFEARLYNAADGSNGRIGVAVIDLGTGRTVSVLGDTPFPMASTSKIAVASTFLDGVDKGKWTLDDKFPLMIPVGSARFSGSKAPVRPGEMLTARRLIELALINSSNPATDALLAAVGGPAAVNRWIKTTGVEGMRIDRDIATLVRDDGEFDPARTVDLRDSATPVAMAQLLSGLFQGQWLSQRSRAFLLGTMERCVTGKRRMRALLPSDARIAHKTGTLNNTASDVGIIQAPDGHAYAVAIYVTGQGGKPNRDARIASIARTIYQANESHQGGSAQLSASR